MLVDAHSHLVPESVFGALPAGVQAQRMDELDQIGIVVDGGRGAGRGAGRSLRDLNAHRRMQERRGIDVSLVGPWIDMVKGPVDSEIQHQLCRTLNEHLAGAVQGAEHTRFLAALPDLDGGRAADELSAAMARGAVGGMLTANPERGTLARGDLDRLWQEAVNVQAPLVIHPGQYRPSERLAPFFMVNIVGNPFETTLAVGSLLGAGVVDRYPDLRLVLVHGGGFFPYQYARMDAVFGRWSVYAATSKGFENGPRAKQPPSEYLRWFYYDTVLYDTPPLRYLLELVGPDRVLAGSDCPFAITDDRPFSRPESLGLGPQETSKVLGANAVELFNLPDGNV